MLGMSDGTPKTETDGAASDTTGAGGPSHVIAQKIEADLAAGAFAGAEGIVTRFPPEPNGFLHVGHAKSICLQFGLPEEYGGQCHLRFDDTNPLKESDEYVQSIQNDVRWLGFDWGDNLLFASNYFEQLYQLAEKLIEKSLAYVDSSSDEDMKAMRGTVTETVKPQ